MPAERICAECDAVLSPDAQGGLCVQCLLKLALNARARAEVPAPVAPVIEKPGDRIGRYKLLQKIGEGGCGVVYMAEQEEPVRRRVALKIIKLGMDTREFIARFEAERQALAMMDHPNIAKIFDAGSTDRPLARPADTLSPSEGEGRGEGDYGYPRPSDERGVGGEGLSAGRPYFVMELVRGVKITEYCDQHHLSTRERLDLLIKVCQAIQHAHQKGIIHRDIKPSNILVTVNDGQPVPKVIDFGIAKATEGRLTDKTLFTAFQQFLGTPAYMSPEQAEMTSLDIDTRSDIYSLGVLLYELLTGKTPFDAMELLAAGLDAMRRTIREKEPPRPSTRLSTLLSADQTEVARHRHTDPPKLIHLLRGDLDWIVMKCLEKDRTRRYETANGLASEIGRYLTDEPVTAAAPTAAYRFGKFARRNKAALGVAAAITAILVVATAVSTWQAIRATTAKEVAKQQAVRAFRAEELAKQRVIEVAAERDAKDKAREDAVAVSTFLTEVFQSPDPERDGRAITVAEMLDRAVHKIETSFTNQPARRRARFQGTLGETYHALGLAREAIPLLEKARDYQLATLGREHPATLNAMNSLAAAYHTAGRWDEALKLDEEVLAVSRKVLGPEHPETLGAMHNLAVSYYDSGRRDEALKLREEVLALKRKVLGPQHRRTIDAMHNLAVSYYDAGLRDEALKLREEVLTLNRKVLGPEHLDTLGAMHNLADSYHAAGRRDEALKLREEVLTLNRKILGLEHPRTLNSMNDLAHSYYAAGRRNDALNLREAVLALSRKVLGLEHPRTLNSMNNLARSYSAAGRREETLKLREEVLTLHRKVLGPEHPETLDAMNDLAHSYYAAGRQNEALNLLEAVLALRRKVLGPEHPHTLGVMHNLASSYSAAGRREEALKLQEEVLTLSRKVLGPEHPDTLKAMNNLAVSYAEADRANSYHAAGRRDEALKLREEVLTLHRKVLGPEHPDTLLAMHSLASSYQVERKYAEAEPLLREILQSRTSRYPSTNDAVVSATSALAGLLHDWAGSERGAGDKVKAAARAREAERLLRDCLAIRAKTLRPESSRLADTRSRLGAALVAIAVIDSALPAEARLASFAEAETLLLNSHGALRQNKTAEPKFKRDSLERLVRLYEAWPKPEQLAEWERKLNEFDAAEKTKP